MKAKTIVALMAIAVAGAAFPATNYGALARKLTDPGMVIDAVKKDTALKTDAERCAALQTVDEIWAAAPVFATWADNYSAFPLTGAKIVQKTTKLSPFIKEEILAHLAYENALNGKNAIALTNRINYALQRIVTNDDNPRRLKRYILELSLSLVRKDIRRKGGTFVGKAGNAVVQARINEIAAALNAPRFAGAKEIFDALGVRIDWDFIEGTLPSEEEVGKLKEQILMGSRVFDTKSQELLSVVLGVDAYNEFVTLYNDGAEGGK